jgi:hypothetical protein
LPKTALCSKGWTAYGDSCYKFSDDKATWLDVEAKCQALGNDVHLASCMVEQEFYYLANQQSKSSDAFFLGITEL